jgi:hypothetical protein
MDAKQIPVRFEEFAAHLDAIFDQVAARGEQITIERGGKLFVLRSKRRRPRQGRHFTFDDPLWDIAGIAHSGGAGDISSNKHKYIADAFASPFDCRPKRKGYPCQVTSQGQE